MNFVKLARLTHWILLQDTSSACVFVQMHAERQDSCIILDTQAFVARGEDFFLYLTYYSSSPRQYGSNPAGPYPPISTKCDSTTCGDIRAYQQLL